MSVKTGTIVIGGGFFGCAVAIHEALKDKSQEITILEQYDNILMQAGANNQARVHTGFHYPRSLETIKSSLENYKRFVTDYKDCIYDKFTNYYAVAKEGSFVNADTFFSVFTALNAPIQKCKSSDPINAVINRDTIDEIFSVEEFAFNAEILRKLLRKRIFAAKNIKLRTNVEVYRIDGNKVHTNIGTFESDRILLSAYAFNNKILSASNLQNLYLNFEMVELCKFKVPEELKNLSLTVMDGPFFSLYPFPAENCHTITHVKHSVRKSSNVPLERNFVKKSNIDLMLADAGRFLPILKSGQYLGSIYAQKALLPKNDHDDGRPILFKKQPDNPHVYNIIGGKLDNIYDLLQVLDNNTGTNVSFIEK